MNDDQQQPQAQGSIRRAWTREDLERLRDGDLDRDQAHRLAEALRSSPDLDRLDRSVRRTDDLIREALLAPPGRAARTARASRIGWFAAGLAAAALALATLAMIYPRRSAPITSPPTDGASGGLAVAATPERPDAIISEPLQGISEPLQGISEPSQDISEPSRGIRVVFSIPLPEDRATSRDASRRRPSFAAASGRTTHPALTDSRDSPHRVRGFLDSVERGDFESAVIAARAADPAMRDAMFSHLGRVTLSTSAARRVMDGLPSDLAVELCGSWLRDGTQRPVAMRHLDRLASSDPAARDHIRGVLMQLLAAKPDLRPWMSSYTNWLFADREPSRRDDRGALIHPPHPGLAMTQAPRAAVPSQPRGHA